MWLQKGKSETADLPELLQELSKFKERDDCIFEMVQSLLALLKAFSFDLVEIGSDQFKADVDRLADSLSPDADAKKIKREFEGRKGSIVKFIDAEGRYLRDKESELKRIIEMLSRSFSDVIGENRQLGCALYDSASRMERAVRLDDIRKIRSALSSEVSKVKVAIQEKNIKDNERMDRLSNQISHLKTNIEKIRGESMRDHLTGAHNRLGFDLLLRNSLDRARLRGEKFSVLMCDIDGFKGVNDRYGHQVGDCVLQLLVKECKAAMRESDSVARYGGEEFALIIPDTSLKAATKRAKAICDSIASKEYAIKSLDSTVTLKFTVSIGVSEFKQADTAETLVNRADRALYQAKALGKNRAVNESELRKDLAAAA